MPVISVCWQAKHDPGECCCCAWLQRDASPWSALFVGVVVFLGSFYVQSVYIGVMALNYRWLFECRNSRMLLLLLLLLYFSFTALRSSAAKPLSSLHCEEALL